ncbi:co-chaperone YbbN [Methylotenera sp.]|jgi:thioredoxin 1|uniref:thioredoxin family protein n=1 Tax=Methylotenera sp. TaxID=2051956 RepID=UPI002719757B|nr:thioredoxin family protein [Methylotenera sp.]MDO9205480.1 thioredoxin family protein [Methylotenera sp.]MDP1522118.1 thioredoxin family protein [Methylotenera sp.]MDP2072333.1 thioredoxin family protein [Methylotenera sp.]MDP2231088.1 thioredoxin family protein [Methylotenera sp.]MDP3005132.1 thioredoxin family protein [Methylotenera sp.]
MAVVALNKANFKETIEKNDFVIVDFWAPWCDPCVAFTPTFEAAAAANPDIVFGMVNTETDPEISDYFEVSQIPGILVIREQAGIHTQIGEIGGPALDEIIKWSRERDMSAVREHYQQEAKKAN